MSNVNAQFAEVQKSAVESVVRLSKISLAGAKALAELQLKAAEAVIADVTANAKAVSGVKDVNEFFKLQNRVAETSVDKGVGYGKAVYEATSKAQAELAAFAQESIARFNTELSAAVQRATESAPQGTEPVWSAVKSGIEAGSAAVDTMTKAAKQVSEMAESTIKAAAAATADAVKAAPKFVAA